MLCNSCGKQKHRLTPVQSSLLSVNLIMCDTCLESKMEPRWTIILAGRQYGPDKVRDFIVKRRYHGKDITANEIIS
jgi:hypothetical protein